VQDFVHLAGVADLIVDDFALARGERARLHEVVDEEAVAAIRRDAAGRGVRLLEIAEILEIGHDVAQAGG
jgi:hypothetical protein